MRKSFISRSSSLDRARLDRRQVIASGLLGSAAFLFHQRLGAAPNMRLVETEDDIEGRFYKPEAPERSVLFEDSASGKRLDLAGRVLNTEGKPVAHALLDVWQTRDVLRPNDVLRTNDVLQTNGEAQYDNEGFGMRGRLYTNDRGFYRLKTLIPKPHDVGNHSRPAHIHFKISAPDGPVLTTQLYIKGDPNIVADPYARPSRMIRPKAAGRGTVARFDFVVRQE